MSILTDSEKPTTYFHNLDDMAFIVLMHKVSKKPKWRTKLLLYSRVLALVLGERGPVHLAEETFVCSEIDRWYLEKYWGSLNVMTAPIALSMPEL